MLWSAPIRALIRGEKPSGKHQQRQCQSICHRAGGIFRRDDRGEGEAHRAPGNSEKQYRDQDCKRLDRRGAAHDHGIDRDYCDPEQGQQCGGTDAGREQSPSGAGSRRHRLSNPYSRR